MLNFRADTIGERKHGEVSPGNRRSTLCGGVRFEEFLPGLEINSLAEPAMMVLIGRGYWWFPLFWVVNGAYKVGAFGCAR